MSVYVVSHKVVELNQPLPECYKWLYVGTERNCIELPTGALTDTTGDNISYLNSSFCELTALYWVWKNCDDDYKGINHYRRFFVNSLFSKSISNVLDEDRIRSEMRAERCIVPSKGYVPGCVKIHYEQHHPSGDYDALRDAILKVDPFAVSVFDRMSDLDYFYPFNMLIANRHVYNEYCAWMFEVLFEVQRCIDFSERDEYQQRVFGFLSERLLGVWLEENRIEVSEYPVLNTEAGRRFRIRLFLQSLLKRAL